MFEDVSEQDSERAAQERRQRLQGHVDAAYERERRRLGLKPPMTLAEARRIALQVSAATNEGIRLDREREAAETRDAEDPS